MCLPSGENTTEWTECSCPLRALPTCCPVATSHTLIVVSPDPDTMCVPSGRLRQPCKSSSSSRSAPASYLWWLIFLIRFGSFLTFGSFLLCIHVSKPLRTILAREEVL